LSERFQSASDLAFSLRALLHEAAAPGSGPGRRSIAVLPFKNLARGAGDEHLGVALADATITELALVHSLLVRPTAAILRFEGRTIEPQEAGRELGVDAVVDGSFQSSGSRLRVTVQLIETVGARPLWGTKIDASLEDLFALQDEVSRKIVEALQLTLTPSDERRLAAAAIPAAPAYELYLKGRFYLFSDTRRPAIDAAIECFEKALELDPQSPLAMIGLADAWSRMAFSFDPEGGWYERAEELTARALALAPGLPEGRNLRARLLWSPRRRFDHAGAMRELSAAIAGRPSLGEAHHWLGMVLNHVGLLDESLASFERSLAISPDEYAMLHIGLVRLLQGRFEEGREVTAAALARATSSWSFYQLGQCQLRLGRTAEAARTADRAAGDYPGDVLIAALSGLLAAKAGDATRAGEFADAVVRGQRSLGHYHHAQYDLGCIHALLGQTREAVAMLRDSATNGFPCLPFFENDPLLESLRGDGEYRRLIADLRAENDGYRRLYRSLRTAREESGDPAAGHLSG
jgi:adenylate cyclase